uniref:ATPase MORC2 n=1 Tax=Myxine glutinosa TaxID=7769 RepID=UPI00358F9886
MASKDYSALRKAELTFDYLHTNSTTHEFLFGALAELVDNSRDAQASRIDIYSVLNEGLRGDYMLCFKDDGNGMDPEEAANVIKFGKSTKRDADHVGRYGNGLKSGSMRIGRDFILFTKQLDTMSCVFLSRSFHEEEKIEEVIVPLPSWKCSNFQPLNSNKRFDLELEIIYKYSPFKTKESLMKQFEEITGDSGTLIVIYNLKLMDNGEPELDFTSDPKDFLMAESTHDAKLERRSFRAYTAVLYIEPRMRIFIQSQKVRTKRLVSCLSKPRMYKYFSNRFKTRTEQEAKKRDRLAKLAEEKAREADSKARDLARKLESSTSKDLRLQLRQAQDIAYQLRLEVGELRKQQQQWQKNLKEPKELTFVFGVNISHRYDDGMFVYNSSRLIKMYEKAGPQLDGGTACGGVVGVVDVPYMILEPTHNKQDFADSKEYRLLLRAMGDYLAQYWKDVGIAEKGIVKFWDEFGYLTASWSQPPSSDFRFKRRRAMEVPTVIQCDLCLKWRVLPFMTDAIAKEYPDSWSCHMNPNPEQNRCSCPEQKPNVPLGVLLKESKSLDQRQEELQNEILRRQEKLDSLQKTNPIRSSADLRRLPIDIGAGSIMRSERREPEATFGAVKQAPFSPSAAGPSLANDGPSEPRTAKPPVGRALAEQTSKTLKSSPSTRNGIGSHRPPAQTQRAAPRSEPVTSPRNAEVKSPVLARVKKSPAAAAAAAAREKTTTAIPKTTRKQFVHCVDTESESEEEKRTIKKKGVGRKRTLVKQLQRNLSQKPSHESSEETDDSADDILPEKRNRPCVASCTSEYDSACLSATSQSQKATHKIGLNANKSRLMGNKHIDLGLQVEARVNSEWHTGRVKSVDNKTLEGLMWKIKFDYTPLGTPKDLWVAKDSDIVRMMRPASPSSEQSSERSTPPQITAPPSVEDDDNNTGESLLLTNLRVCLRKFLPPGFCVKDDEIGQMSAAELEAFPMAEFLKSCDEQAAKQPSGACKSPADLQRREPDLGKLVSETRLNEVQKQLSLEIKNRDDIELRYEESTSKLRTLRKNIIQLLCKLQEDIDLEEDRDGEDVDLFLQDMLNQL